ncbi:MAG: hypothetical protein K9M19_05060 [Candidatus Marinimicrobia bacterium]|nr:hypothetical protein [Candidatus Neomarinimicrobiota bacterium]
MKKHSGMRPHDIIILLKIAIKESNTWTLRELGIELEVSFSEISESLNRSVLAGLLAEDKRTLMRQALVEFLMFGLKYVFPQKPGSTVRGIKTAYSAPPLSDIIQYDEKIVWPWPEGMDRGVSIEPLHPKLPGVCVKDKRLYELAALTDALRMGGSRERQLAAEELRKRLL